MRTKLFKGSLLMGVAIFSMFFGAGNTIYPILLATEAKGHFGWAFCGFLVTAISGPLFGLVGGILYKGRSIDFFFRAGKWPGLLLLGSSLALLGPFAVLPRCVSVSFAAAKAVAPFLSLTAFVVLFCTFCFFCTTRVSVLLKILGYFLSPLLICCLLLMILKGWHPPQMINLQETGIFLAFSKGLYTGYDTMDLIASIIFSAGIWRMAGELFDKDSPKKFKVTLISGLIACALLSLIYFGLSHIAIKYSSELSLVPKQELMSQLALLTLGPKLGVVANICVMLACLTTVIGLTMTISDIVSKEILLEKLSYKAAVFWILLITALMTFIGFETISVLIHSVVKICYPIIIVLTFYNIFAKVIQRNKISKSQQV